MNNNIYNFHDWLIEKDINFYSEATFTQNAVALATIIGSLIFGTAGINVLRNMPQEELKNTSTPVELATKIMQHGQERGFQPKVEAKKAAVDAIKKVQNNKTPSPSAEQDSDTVYFTTNPDFHSKNLTPGVHQLVQCDKDGNILPNGMDYQKAQMHYHNLGGPEVKIIHTQNPVNDTDSLNKQLRGN